MASPPLQGLIHYSDETKENEQIWDDRYFPIMTLATIGVPTLELMNQAWGFRDKLLEYAKQNGIHALLLSDLSRLKTPNAALRKEIGEIARVKDAPYKGVQLATVYTVTNPLVRGMVTAVSWVAGDAMIPNSYVADIRGAIKEMDKLYAAIGKERPDFPSDYKFDGRV